MLRFRPRYLILGFTLVTLGAPGRAHAGFVGDLSAGPIYDDNVNQSERGVDREHDWAMTYAGSAGLRFQISKGGSLAIAATMEGLDFHDFDGLDRWSPGGIVSWRQKTRLGARAPSFQVSGAASFQDFRDGAREGWIYQAKLRYAWSAGERVGFAVEAGYLLRNAGTTVFDQNATSLSFRADVPLRGRYALYAAYQIRRGDVTSSSPPNPGVLASAKERALDPVFGPGVIAYRLEATSHDVQLGFNCALGNHASIDIRYERILALASSGIDYGVNQFSGRYLYRF